MKTLFAVAIATVSLACGPALSADHAKGHKMNMKGDAMHKMHKMHGEKIMIKTPWARASVGRNGAAYFTVSNMLKTDAKVVGVMADVAKRAELHTHRMDGEIMRMRPLENIVVPAGASVTLKPGGHHVMLMGLTRKLKEGDSFPLTVVFANGNKQQVSVKVGKIGAAGPMGSMKHMKHMDGHGHHKMKH